MQRFTSVLISLVICFAVSACGSPQPKADNSNSKNEQRMNADQAQRELSSEVKK